MPKSPKFPIPLKDRYIVTPEEEERIRMKVLRHIIRLRCEAKPCDATWCKRSNRCEKIAHFDRAAARAQARRSPGVSARQPPTR